MDQKTLEVTFEMDLLIKDPPVSGGEGLQGSDRAQYWLVSQKGREPTKVFRREPLSSCYGARFTSWHEITREACPTTLFDLGDLKGDKKLSQEERFVVLMIAFPE